MKRMNAQSEFGFKSYKKEDKLVYLLDIKDAVFIEKVDLF